MLLLLSGLACSLSPESDEVLSETSAAGPEPPLVILISLDTLRADHLGSYGYPEFTSPTLDAFAAEGTLFEDASAPAPWTLPSHASMLTGLYPLEHGVVTAETVLPQEVDTLASLLEAEGFETAAVVNSTWLTQKTFGLTRDFDRFHAVNDSDYGRRTPSVWVTDQAIEWIREARESPLFVFMHYYDVHADYASQSVYEKLFVTEYEGVADGTGWQLQAENFDPRHIAYCLSSFSADVCAFGSREKPRIIDESLRKPNFDQRDARHLEQLYDAGIRQLDAELGRFFRFLDAADLSERSLVIVTADHGEEFLDHGAVDHSMTAYQELLHVPMIWRGPGIPGGIRVEAPVSLVDIVPTVLAWVGASALPTLAGQDLLPLMSEESEFDWSARPIWGEASAAESQGAPLDSFYPLFRSVRQGSFKLIQEVRGGQTFLFDLERDPTEQRNLSVEQPERTQVLTELLEDRHRQANPSTGKEVQLDPEAIERLRALGYVP